MNKVLFFLGTTIGGYLGWWAGEAMGFDMMGAFLISSVGSIAGIYAAWRIIVDYLD